MEYLPTFGKSMYGIFTIHGCYGKFALFLSCNIRNLCNHPGFAGKKKTIKHVAFEGVFLSEGMVSLSFEHPPFDKHNTPHGSGTSHLFANYIYGLMLNRPV